MTVNSIGQRTCDDLNKAFKNVRFVFPSDDEGTLRVNKVHGVYDHFTIPVLGPMTLTEVKDEVRRLETKHAPLKEFQMCVAVVHTGGHKFSMGHHVEELAPAPGAE